MDKPSISYQEFVDNFYGDILPNKPIFIRPGQSLMNYLAIIWIEEYKRLSSVDYYDATNIDCFHNDKLIPNTLKHLEKVWV